MTCIEALYLASDAHTSLDKKYMLRSAATLLESAVGAFSLDPSLENMIELNGVWSYCAKVLKAANDTPQQPRVA